MILVTGGTGFVGQQLVRRMRAEGLPVRIVVRNPEKARPLKDLGAEVVAGDIGDAESLHKAAVGVERVVHLVGIIQEAPGATFQDVHVDGTRNLLEAAKGAGVSHFLYQSALGARPAAASGYHKTKWEAEGLVRAGGIPYTILRPSLIYGTGDLFTVRLANMIRLSPVLPVLGSGKSKVQPLFIDDAVTCMLKALTSERFLNGTYELGGPDQLTYEEVTNAIAETLGVNRPTLHLPLFFMKPMARILETALPKPPLTSDQLIMIQEDNVCGMSDIGDFFGIEPISFRDGLRKVVFER